MRELEAHLITQTVSRLCQEANYLLGEDVMAALKAALQTEASPLGKEVLNQLLENARIAAQVRANPRQWAALICFPAAVYNKFGFGRRNRHGQILVE